MRGGSLSFKWESNLESQQEGRMRFPFRFFDGIYVVLKTLGFFAISSVTVLYCARCFPGRARDREGLEFTLQLFRTPCSSRAGGHSHNLPQGRKSSLAPNLFTDVLRIHV